MRTDRVLSASGSLGVGARRLADWPRRAGRQRFPGPRRAVSRGLGTELGPPPLDYRHWLTNERTFSAT